MKYFLIIAALLLSGCYEARIKAEAEKLYQQMLEKKAEESAAKTATAPKVAVTLKAEGISTTPKEGESKLDFLLRQKAETEGALAAAVEREKQAKQEQADLKMAKASVEKQISEERIQIVKNKAYWVAGIAGVIAVGLLILTAFITVTPAITKMLLTGAALMGAIAVCALGLAWLVDYLKWVVLGGVGILGIVIVTHLRNVRNVLNGTVKSVESMKDVAGEAGKAILTKNLGEKNPLITAVRKRLKLLKTEQPLQQIVEGGSQNPNP